MQKSLLVTILAVGIAASGCSSASTDAAPRLDGSTAASSTAAPAADSTGTADDDVAEPSADSTSSSTSPTSSPEPTTTTSATPPPRTDACVTGRDTAIGLQTGGVVSNGVEYTWQWTVPSSYAGAPTPVVLDFHGIGSNGAQQAVFSGFAALAEQEGFVAVHPTGTIQAPDDRNSWELPQFDTDDRDDVAFVEELLAELGERVCVDQQRIYATGMSNGAFFTSVLVCELADRIAAAVSVAGVTHTDECEPSRPVPYLAFHGRDDTTVPYAGGGETTLSGADGGGSFFEQVMPAEFAEFADTFGCTASVDETLSEHVTRTTWTGCDDDVEVAFHTIEDGGHTWPGSAISSAITSLGNTTDEIDATAVAWEFFSRHTNPLNR